MSTYTKTLCGLGFGLLVSGCFDKGILGDVEGEGGADDGSGTAGEVRDVGVRGDRITAIGEFDIAVTAFTAAADDVELRATTTGA